MDDATTALINILKHCAAERLLTASDLAYMLSTKPPFDVHDFDLKRGTTQMRLAVREALLLLTRQSNIDWTRVKSEASGLLKAAQANDAERARAREETRPIPVAIEINELVPDGTVLNWFTGTDGEASFVALLCRLPNDSRYITARRLADPGAPTPWPEILVEPSWRVHFQNAIVYKKSVWIPVLDTSRALWTVFSVLNNQQYLAPIDASAELIGLVAYDDSLLMIASTSRGSHICKISLYDVMQKREHVTLSLESLRLRRILSVVEVPGQRLIAIGDSGDRARLVQLLGPADQESNLHSSRQRRRPAARNASISRE